MRSCVPELDVILEIFQQRFISDVLLHVFENRATRRQESRLVSRSLLALFWVFAAPSSPDVNALDEKYAWRFIRIKSAAKF